MTISSTGLIEWTPTKASEITTHSNITITLTTASGYVLTEAYDLTVTGTCTTGNVMAIWSGDQRTSKDSSKLLGNITAYTDNSSSVKTASQNYNYYDSSVHLTHGPTPTATTGNVFFYNQYDNTTDFPYTSSSLSTITLISSLYVAQIITLLSLGRSSMGKTSFAMNIAESAVISSGKTVLVFSMEMPSNSLIMRMLSSLGRIDQSKIRSGQLGDEDWPRLTSAVTLLNDKPLLVDDTASLSPNEIRSRARRVVREHGDLGLIMVDYIQLMRSGNIRNEGRVQEISEITQGLKSVAKELDVPIIALSQLSRAVEQREDKRPQLADLRESGSIEQDADVVMFIHREEKFTTREDWMKNNPGIPYPEGQAEIIIAKHRNGPYRCQTPSNNFARNRWLAF